MKINKRTYEYQHYISSSNGHMMESPMLFLLGKPLSTCKIDNGMKINKRTYEYQHYISSSNGHMTGSPMLFLLG
jgi:hypothetical protein